MKKTIIITSVLFAILLIAPFFIDICAAQPGPPGGGGGPTGPPCWPPPCIPIDGGISLLVLAGIAFGGKKALDMAKGKKVG